MHDDTHFVLMLPFTIGVTTLLLFSGWLRTESGTVIRAGSFPCNVVKVGTQTSLRVSETVQKRSIHVSEQLSLEALCLEKLN